MARHHGTYNKQIRRIAREQSLADLRDGRRTRNATHPDRKKEGNKKACRLRVGNQTEY